MNVRNVSVGLITTKQKESETLPFESANWRFFSIGKNDIWSFILILGFVLGPLYFKSLF